MGGFAMGEGMRRRTLSLCVPLYKLCKYVCKARFWRNEILLYNANIAYICAIYDAV